MNAATASKIDHTQTSIGHLLARRGVDLLLSFEEGNALIQCQVSSAVAAAMLAPLKGMAAGQFRPLPGNLVEIDASVTLEAAIQMVEGKRSSAALLNGA
jgi:hypothetical protein